MFYIYLHVLSQGQAHGSCRPFRDPLSKKFRVVLDHGLDACLVVHVLDEFLGGFVSHNIHLGLVSLPASKKILHIDTMSHDLVSHTIGFTIVDRPSIVCHKSILTKIFTHDHLCLSTRVCTNAAGTPSGTRSFNPCKC